MPTVAHATREMITKLDAFTSCTDASTLELAPGAPWPKVIVLAPTGARFHQTVNNPDRAVYTCDKGGRVYGLTVFND